MDPTENPDHGANQYSTTPFTADTTQNPKSHVQPLPDLPDAALPGEQNDPRLC